MLAEPVLVAVALEVEPTMIANPTQSIAHKLHCFEAPMIPMLYDKACGGWAGLAKQASASATVTAAPPNFHTP